MRSKLALALCFCLLPAVVAAQDPRLAAVNAEVLAIGKALFEKQFAAGEPIAPGGDGLGPLFNHVSCIACHQQGGIGGGGPVDVNATMLSVDMVKFETAPERKDFRRLLSAVHPGFVTTDGETVTSVILHRFGTDGKYNAIREKLVGTTIPLRPDAEDLQALQDQLARQPAQFLASARPLTMAITQRNTTACFGDGLIDQIPDATIRAIEAAQKKHPEISGRVAPVENTKVGRFGWRGQIASLHEFVLGACANELGLQVPTKTQPMDPLRPDYKAPALDLTAPQCVSLTAFVASLPAPRSVKPQDEQKLKVVERGYQVFHTIGCAVCHVENVAPAEGIYSDLLLHDLGPALADPVEAQATYVVVEQSQIPIDGAHSQNGEIVQDSLEVTSTQVRHYYGGSSRMTMASGQGVLYRTKTGYMTVVPNRKDQNYGIRTKYDRIPTNTTQEWRTAPLWGVADSAPYMHDGRAATVLEAIALHGGEADGTTQRFLALSTGDRLALLEFMNCLKAPAAEAKP
jgi:CxxC motif-containing protein (DUF1111 family)